jgi:hypothetical protein
MMDRWLRMGSFTKSNEKLDEQSIASSTSALDLEPIQGGDIGSKSRTEVEEAIWNQYRHPVLVPNQGLK